MLMRDMYSWSTSDDWSRESSVAAGAALHGRSSLAVVAALVGVAEVLVGRVAMEDWSVEDAGWTGGDWTEVGVAGVGVDADAEWLPVGDG